MGSIFATGLAAGLLGLPLVGSGANALLGQYLNPATGRRVVAWIGPGVVLLSFVAAVMVLLGVVGTSSTDHATTIELWRWLDLGSHGLRVNVSVTFDPLSALMLMVITGVGFLIHWYSVGYMEHDATPHRFFAYMNLFIFSMVLLVLAANLVILIVGWALVALSSYLLIGYWYERPAAVLAARKAFVTQVIGDLGLVIAAFMILTRLRSPSLDLLQIFTGARESFGYGTLYLTGICTLLAIGAFAKSAQFPLHTWLPDAMEGPTPVSALIHAATMVTAGVYLIARFHPLFDLAPVAQGMVAAVGMGTAFMAGYIALSQIDIKRVIAYSTMSQIGLMTFAVGIGAYTAGMFHFATHALFKALLFLAAGNVIHALHEEQDIRAMGGLAIRMRWTNACFLVGSFALAGIPIFAGWFSKEEILGLAWLRGPMAPLLWFAGVGVNVLTGLYAFRLYFAVFHGEPATARCLAAREARPVMLVPVMVLAAGSLVGGLVMLPGIPGIAGRNLIDEFLTPVVVSFGGHVLSEATVATAASTLAAGTLLSLLGVGLAYRWCYLRRPDAATVASRLPRLLTQLSLHKFYFDEVYDAILVRPWRFLANALKRVVEPRVMDGWVGGLTNFFGEVSLDFRFLQTGLVRDYASMTLGAAGLFVLVMVVWIAR